MDKTVYILEDRKIRVEWTILKGTSPVREDFRRALVKVFLIGNCEKYLLEATADRGTLMIDIPEGLEPGLYSLEAIWVKNAGHPGRHDRDLCRSMKQDLFAITEFEEEATNLPEGTVVLKAKSSTATYGYDGLSSYELAVLRGEWNGTEGEWLKHQRYVSVLDGRGDSEVDTMSQKSITEELVKHDTAIEGANKEIDTAQTDIKNLNDEMDEVQDRLAYIPKESFLSSEPACDYHTEDNQDELTVSRAIKDRFGRIIDEHYVTRETVKDYTQEVVDGSKLEIQPGSVQPEDLSPAVQQMIESAAAQPGHITNLPDEEDLTVTEHNTLQFKDREYNPYNYSGMGKVYLRKHIVNGTNMLTQHMMRKPNTIYVIRYDYCLGGETIEVPEGCVLEFDGGSLRNGGIVFKNTTLSENSKIYTNVDGNIVNSIVKVSWFTKDKDITKALNNIIKIIDEGEIQIDKTSCYISDTVNITKSNIQINGLNHNVNVEVPEDYIGFLIGNPIQDLSVWDEQDYNVYQNVETLQLEWIYNSNNNYFTTFIPGYNNVQILSIVEEKTGIALSDSDYFVEDYIIDNSYGKSNTVYKKYHIIKDGLDNYDKFVVNISACKKFGNQNYLYLKDISSIKKGRKVIVANQFEFQSLYRAYYKAGEICKVQGISDSTTDEGYYSVYMYNNLYGNYGSGTKVYIDINDLFIENVSIKNINFVGNYKSNSLISINKVDGVILDNVKTIGGNTNGVNFSLCINVSINNCSFSEAIDLDGDIALNYSCVFNGCNVVNISNSIFNGGRHSIDFGRGYVSPYYSSSEQSNIVATQGSNIRISNCIFGNNSIKEAFDIVKNSFMSHCVYNMQIDNCFFTGDLCVNATNLFISNCVCNRTGYIQTLEMCNINNCSFERLNLPDIYCKYFISDTTIKNNITTSGTDTQPNPNELLIREIHLDHINSNGNLFFSLNSKQLCILNSKLGLVSTYNFDGNVDISNCELNSFSSRADIIRFNNNYITQEGDEVELNGVKLLANNLVYATNNTLLDIVPYSKNISNVINSALYVSVSNKNAGIIIVNNNILYSYDLNKQIDFEYYILSAIVANISSEKESTCYVIIDSNNVKFLKKYDYYKQEAIRICIKNIPQSKNIDNVHISNNHNDNSTIYINEYILPELKEDTNLYHTLYKPFGPVFFFDEKWRNIDGSLLDKVQIM